MNEEDILKKLKKTGIPVAYRCFPEGDAPPLPFICYFTTGSNNFAADGKVYYAGKRFMVELYCSKKDLELEKKVEDALEGLFWEKEESYIESEKCYQIAYEMEV